MMLPKRESGFTLIELSVALAVIALLVVAAVASFTGMRRQSIETAAQVELRDALVPLHAHLLDGDPALSLEDGIHAFAGNIRFDVSAVDGIKVEEATDGSVCMWRIAETGRVFGVWTVGAATLYAELGALPSDCPDQSEVGASGFVAAW